MIYTVVGEYRFFPFIFLFLETTIDESVIIITATKCFFNILGKKRVKLCCQCF